MSSRPVFIATPFIFLLIAYFVDYNVYTTTRKHKLVSKIWRNRIKHAPRAQMMPDVSSWPAFFAAPSIFLSVDYNVYMLKKNKPSIEGGCHYKSYL